MTSEAVADGLRLTWTDEPWRADVFYRVYRGTLPDGDLQCSTSNDYAWVCYFFGEPLGTTRDGSFVVTDPRPGATYRIGVGTNWANDPDLGDISSSARPSTAGHDIAARGLLGSPGCLCRRRVSSARVHADTRTRTNYDEGVYLASLDAMRRGQELGSEIYTSQPPVFYWLLRLLAAPFENSVADIRLAFALLATAGVGAAMALTWRLYGPPAAVATGALVVIAVPYPTFASTVAADFPPWFSVSYRSCSSPSASPARSGWWWWAGAAGAVLALAVLTKILAIPFVVPFVALALAARATRRVLAPALVGAGLVASIVVVAHRAALGDIWRQVVTDHTDAPGPRHPLGEPRPDPLVRASDPVRLAGADRISRVGSKPACAYDVADVYLRASGCGTSPPCPPAHRPPPRAALGRMRDLGRPQPRARDRPTTPDPAGARDVGSRSFSRLLVSIKSSDGCTGQRPS